MLFGHMKLGQTRSFSSGVEGLGLRPHLSASHCSPRRSSLSTCWLSPHLQGSLPFAQQPTCWIMIDTYDLRNAEKQSFSCSILPMTIRNSVCVRVCTRTRACVYVCVHVWSLEETQVQPSQASEYKQHCPWFDVASICLLMLPAFFFKMPSASHHFMLSWYLFSIISFAQGSLHIWGTSLSDL